MDNAASGINERTSDVYQGDIIESFTDACNY